jgi:23S rRNA (uracil1939-C5)-methyltransferase
MSDPQQPSSVVIEKLVYGGDGLARLASNDGPDAPKTVVFVPYTVPNETVLLQDIPLAGKNRYAVKQVLHTGPDRVTPACDVFGTCGGCHWQHVSAPAQAHWKQAIVTETLAKIAHLGEVPIQPILSPSPEQYWGHRNHVQWSWNEATRELGYLQSGSHTVVAFQQCPIMSATLNTVAQAIRDTMPDNIGVKRIVAREGHNQQCMLVLHSLHQKSIPALTEWAKALVKAHPTIIGVLWQAAAKAGQLDAPAPKLLCGKRYVTYQLNGFNYRVGASSFFQTHTPMANVLLKTVRQWLSPVDTAVDLFCGVGLFALGLNNFARQWYCLDVAPSSVADGAFNIIQHGRANVALLVGDGETALDGAPWAELRAELAIIDPPRGGCTPAVIDWLTTHISQTLIYVSCDPATLARDCRVLCDKGWTIKVVQPLDMFPQTYHVETVVLLRRHATVYTNSSLN